MRSWVTSRHEVGPELDGLQAREPLIAAAPSGAPCRPGVARAGREQEHEIAVGDLPRRERRGRGRAAGRRRSCARVVEVRTASGRSPERVHDRIVHRALHVDAAQVGDVLERAPDRSTAPRAAATKFASETSSSHSSSPPDRRRRGSAGAAHGLERRRLDAPRRHLHLERERTVGDRVRGEEPVASASATRSPATAPSPKLNMNRERSFRSRAGTTRGTPRRGGRSATPARPRGAREPRGARPAFPSRRCRTRLHTRRAAEPVRDPRRCLPDRVVLPRRAVVEDDVDRRRIDLVAPRAAARGRTARSLTCSSAAAMCLPRRPNFSTITPRGCRSPRRPRPRSSTARAGTRRRGEADGSHSPVLERRSRG